LYSWSVLSKGGNDRRAHAHTQADTLAHTQSMVISQAYYNNNYYYYYYYY